MLCLALMSFDYIGFNGDTVLIGGHYNCNCIMYFMRYKCKPLLIIGEGGGI